MLALLLYNTFGLSIAVLFFKSNFDTASNITQDDEWKTIKFEAPSLPYTNSWENEDGFAGLFESDGQFYNATNVLLENDTIYVTLKSNLNARDRFFELADRMEINAHHESGKSLPANVIKLLSDIHKIYVNTEKYFSADYAIEDRILTSFHSFRDFTNLYQSPKYWHFSPPPEAC